MNTPLPFLSFVRLVLANLKHEAAWARFPDNTVEPETKEAQPDHDETGKDFVAKITAVDSLLCVKTSTDLTNDEMAWSGTFPVAELDKGHVNSAL